MSFRPYIDCVQSSNEGNYLWLEYQLLVKQVRKLWKWHKIQEKLINKLLTGQISGKPLDKPSENSL